MARSAKVISIDAVRELSAALTIFGEEATAALDDLEINVRRAIEWIEQDRKQYWETAVRRGWEQVGEARAELEKALTYRKVADRTPSCREERAALEKAKRRVQIAEEVNRSLPGWSHRIQHAVRELTGAKTLLSDWLHGDLPRAQGALKQMSVSLETYAAVQQPVRRETPSVAAAGDEAQTPGGAAKQPAADKEQTNEDMGSPRAGREAASGDEGPERG